MGLFSSISMFNPTINMGNTAMLGNSCRGMQTVMEKCTADAISKGYAVLVFRNMSGRFSAAASGGSRRVFSLNSNPYAPTGTLDIYAGLTDTDYAHRMLESFDRYRPINDTMSMLFEDYIALIVRLCHLSRRRVKMKEFIGYDIAVVERMNNTLVTDPAEHYNNDLVIRAVQANAAALQAYFRQFARNRVGEVLSGADSLETVLDRNDVVEISLDFDNNDKESVILMDAIIDRVCDLRYSAMIKKQLCVIADQISNQYMQDSGLNRVLQMFPRCMMVYSVTDMCNLVKNSTDWLNRCTTTLCFRQNDQANMDYCSGLFGKIRRPVPTPSFFGGRLGLGIGFELVPKYGPEVFAALADDMAIHRNTMTNSDGRVRII